VGIYLYIATVTGLFIVTQTYGQWHIIAQTLKNRSLTSVAVSEGAIMAGTKDGVWRSTDRGRTWSEANRNLAIRHVRWMASLSQSSKTVLVGTEPAGIFVSRDNGSSWSPSPEVEALRDEHRWFLPYSPKAGCVRGFAVAESGSNLNRVYAAVEVGGVLVSDDRGDTWRLADGSDGKPDMNRDLGTMIHPDVHSISAHPTSSDIVTAATGRGLFRSIDGGRTWKNIYPCYIRAMWVNPGDPQHIVAGPADGVSRNGRIEESFDSGRKWQSASEGLNLPWPRTMVERFVQVGDQLFAVLSSGELWAKPLNQAKWRHLLPEITGVKAVAAGS
jgi:photosystem II stability/assembly factor-like uncharacterized protein